MVDNLSRRGTDVNLAWLQERGLTEFVLADVRDARAIDDLLRRHADADAVLHLAGQVAVTTSVTDPRADFEANALGTLNVLEAVRLAASGRPALFRLLLDEQGVRQPRKHVRVVERDGRYAYEDRPNGPPASTSRSISLQPLRLLQGAGDQYAIMRESTA